MSKKEKNWLRSKRVMSWVLSLAFMFSCVLFVPPMRSEAAGDTVSSATSVTFDVVNYGRISSYNTKDWYKIVLPRSGELTIKTQAEMERVYYTLYNADCSTTYIERAVYWDNTTKISNRTYEVDLVAGTYYFLVNEDYSTGDYNLKFSFKSSKETFLNSQNKNDNSRASANKIAFGKTYKGHLAENDNLDFYKFSISKNSTVQIKGTSYMYCIGYYLYDGDGNELDCWAKYWDATTEVGNFSKSINLRKGTYYLVVKQYSNTGNYSIKLTAITPGWKKTKGKWWYQYEDGSWPAGQFATIKGKKYYFNANGYMATGWKRIDGEWYYMNKKTGVVKTGWLKYSGKWYYMDSNGEMISDTYHYYKGKCYYFNRSGVCINP